MLFAIQHFLRRCTSRRAYLTRRICIIGSIVFLYLTTIFNSYISTNNITTVGLESFIVSVSTLFFFIAFFVPTSACKLIDDDRKNGVLPLLMMTQRSSFSIIFHKYISFLILTCIHGVATLPILLMCAHFGGVSSQQILLTYVVLFLYTAFAAALSILFASRFLFPPTKCLITTFMFLMILETFSYILHIPVSPIFCLNKISNGYVEHILSFSLIYVFFILICLLMSCSIEVFIFSRKKKKKQSYLLEKMKRLQKNYDPTNLTIEDSFVQREEKRQEFQSLYSFTSKTCFIGRIGFIPILSWFAPMYILPLVFLGLALYTALAFTNKNKQELELLSMTKITPERFLKAKKKAMWLAVNPLGKYSRTYFIVGLFTIPLFLLGLYTIIWGFIMAVIFAWATYIFTSIAFYCSAKYKEITKILIISSLYTIAYLFLLFSLTSASQMPESFFILAIISTYFVVNIFNKLTLKEIFFYR